MTNEIRGTKLAFGGENRGRSELGSSSPLRARTPDFSDGAGGLLEAPELLAGLLNLALVGILVEAAFDLPERYTVIRWGTKTVDRT